jgi:phosphohistidine phosphatase
MPGPFHLYLVRHAIAEERGPAWPDDSQRPLTAEGAKRWRREATGLVAIDARPDLILTSPFTRARQTADLLAAAFAKKPKVMELAALKPGVKARDVLRALQQPEGRIDSLALVGHEPDLGELAALLVGFKTAPEFKKGGVARIDVAILPPPAGSGQLHSWLTPKILRALS